MAKQVTATKGGLTLTNGYLVVSGARFISMFDEVTGVVTKVERWVMEWKLFPSQAEAEVLRNGGVPIESGQFILPYVANKDPIDEGYKLLQAELAKKWTITSVTDKP